MDAIYNHLLNDYAMKLEKKPAVRKESELKKHYNDIVSRTKQTPLYLVQLSDEKQEYVLDVKGMALELQEAVNEFHKKGKESPFYDKEALSYNEDAVHATIDTEDYDSLPDKFSVKVMELAKPQMNYSKAYYAEGKGLPAGDYKFEISVEDKRYLFSYSVGHGANNLEIETELADYINQSGIGLEAEVERDSAGKMIQMSIRSDGTGNIGKPMFTLKDIDAKKSEQGLVDYYDLNHRVLDSSSAKFEINGEPMEALNNRFVLNNSVKMELKETTQEPITVIYQTNPEKAMTAVQQTVDRYNAFVDRTNQYATDHKLYPRLANEMKQLMKKSKSEMESVGIQMTEDGKLELDSMLAYGAIESGEMQKTFEGEHSWMDALTKKMDRVATDPMEYVEKKVVAYPNYAKQGLGFTYMTSIYSGMLFNYYC